MIVSSQYFTTISTKSKIIPNNNTFGLISYIFHEKYRLNIFFPQFLLLGLSTTTLLSIVPKRISKIGEQQAKIWPFPFFWFR